MAKDIFSYPPKEIEIELAKVVSIIKGSRSPGWEKCFCEASVIYRRMVQAWCDISDAPLDDWDAPCDLVEQIMIQEKIAVPIVAKRMIVDIINNWPEARISSSNPRGERGRQYIILPLPQEARDE